MVCEGDEEKAAKGKLHSEVISLKDSIRPSEVSIVHTRSHTQARKLANIYLYYRRTEALRARGAPPRTTPVKSI